MTNIQKVGIAVFFVALLIFTLSLGLDQYRLSANSLAFDGINEYHKTEILAQAEEQGKLDKVYPANFSFIKDFKALLKDAQKSLAKKAKEDGVPEGVKEWDYKLGSWKFKDYLGGAIKASAEGPVSSNPLLFLFLTFGLGIIGGLLYILPIFQTIPGIKNNHIFHSSLTRGLKWTPRAVFLAATILGVLIYGFTYMGEEYVWPTITGLIGLLIIGLVFYYENQRKRQPSKSAAPAQMTAWLGVFAGVYLIAFYVLLYWKSEYITAWITIVNPVSKALSGNDASQWFLYGLLYTVIVLVMGVRMLAKYRHNKYQMLRTGSVMFFQLSFAFLIPEILVRLNQPYFDFKNIWPLNYTFFFDWNIKSLMNSGGLGVFMMVWGIVLVVVGVPLFTYFFGKRWYCSWVCGCGGLAETMGDPYRQLSDKSLSAWRFERWIIHGVLVFAIGMTALTLYTYFTGSSTIVKSSFLTINSDSIRTWYGFLIGSAFAGVVGTGFYPLMGNRVWCRFGCPLAAYLGLVQRFQSRFRITTNGGQCISCGNCSTYCEMGIDVRWYAQRGQDIVRSSCVGCGICSAVCPRGVLRLENSSEEISTRAEEVRALHINDDKVELVG